MGGVKKKMGNCQLLKEYNMEKAVFPAFVAPKFDGIRAISNKGYLYSRNGNIINGISHIEKFLKQEPFNKYEYDGELIVPNKGFDLSSGIIRREGETPEVVYNIFDIKDFSMTKKERLFKLFSLFDNYEHKKIKLIAHFIVHNNTELINYYYDFLNHGHEGLIYYSRDSKYKCVRSYEWMKKIPIKTADCKVLDFIEGTGKNKNSLGALIVEYKGKKCKVGCGFNELLSGTNKLVVRKYIWKNKNHFKGKIAECKYKEETKNGIMRQPIFLKWRFDKNESN